MALAVHFGDVRDVVANLLTLTFFVTPVLYPLEAVPERFRPLVHANPLASWLLREAWKATSSVELAQSFLSFLRHAGFPVDRSTIIMPTLHAQIFATVLVWRVWTS